MRPPGFLCAAALAAMTAFVACGALATPAIIDQVAFAPDADALLPLDAQFVDEHGRTVRLGDYFGDRPVIIVLGYYGCSNLCGVVLESLVHSLAVADLHSGHDVEIVAVSIAPLETPDLARQRKRSVLAGIASAEKTGWHFLTGTQRSIDRVAATLGYRYQYDEVQHEYAHAAGIVVGAPDGHLTHTLYGVAFAPDVLRQALQAAARPSLSAASDDKWLLCFHYDPQTGRYTFVAMSAVRLAALAALAGLCGFFIRARSAR